MNNIVSSIKQKKIDNKNFYQSENFKKKWQKLKEINKPSMVNNDLSECLDSLLEVYRNEIFFIPNYQYSLVYDNMIIQKIFLDDIYYVIHPLENYKNRIVG